MLQINNTSNIVLLDVDGPCADLTPAWYAFHNELNGTDYQVPDEWETTPEIKETLKHPDLYNRVPPVHGYPEGVMALRAAGFHVVYVSSCAFGRVDCKTEWLARHDPAFDPDDFIACHHKWLVSGAVLIDDAPHNLDRSPDSIRTIRFVTNQNGKTMANGHMYDWSKPVATVIDALHNPNRYVILGGANG